MRRTKKWWARLSRQERGLVVYFERNTIKYGYRECTICKRTVRFKAMCEVHQAEYQNLLNKANGEVTP